MISAMEYLFLDVRYISLDPLKKLSVEDLKGHYWQSLRDPHTGSTKIFLLFTSVKYG